MVSIEWVTPGMVENGEGEITDRDTGSKGGFGKHCCPLKARDDLATSYKSYWAIGRIRALSCYR